MNTLRGASRWLWLVLVLLFVIGLTGAGYYIIQRGAKRSDVISKAAGLVKQGKREEAKALLRKQLSPTLAAPRTRAALIDLHIQDAEYDEATRLATEWRAMGGSEGRAESFLIEVAIRQGRVQEAQQLARKIADVRPLYALQTVLKVQDAIGSVRSRWQAQRTAVNLATISNSEAVKARMYIFAAETLQDLPARNAKKAKGTANVRQAQRYASMAQSAIERASEADMRGSLRKQLRAHIQLLSDISETRKTGESTLLQLVKDEQAAATSRASLVTHFMKHGETQAAVEHLRKLESERPLAWIRGVGRLARTGKKDEVLKLLDESYHCKRIWTAHLAHTCPSTLTRV